MAAGESAADRQGGNSTGFAVTGKLASRIRLRAGDPVGESCACACYSRKVPVRTLCGGCASKPSGQRLSPISIGLARVRIGFVVSSKRYAMNVSLLAFEASGDKQRDRPRSGAKSPARLLASGTRWPMCEPYVCTAADKHHPSRARCQARALSHNVYPWCARSLGTGSRCE